VIAEFVIAPSALNAQTGKSITPRDSAILLALARAL
jgi:hypothetical protein